MQNACSVVSSFTVPHPHHKSFECVGSESVQWRRRKRSRSRRSSWGRRRFRLTVEEEAEAEEK